MNAHRGLPADRREHQPGQLRGTALQPARRRARHQHDDQSGAAKASALPYRAHGTASGDQILKTGSRFAGMDGVSVQDVTPELAASHAPDARCGSARRTMSRLDGPAFRANMRPGDSSRPSAGRSMHDGHDSIRETISREVGQPVQLEIIRAGQHYSANVTLAERPEAAASAPPVQLPATAHQGIGTRRAGSGPGAGG